jgi:hypothetical protein
VKATLERLEKSALAEAREVDRETAACRPSQVHLECSRERRPRHALPDKVEISHRTRSFLFLAGGCDGGGATGTPLLHIPENGLIALNSPLGASRRGTLSTRTTHPRYL